MEILCELESLTWRDWKSLSNVMRHSCPFPICKWTLVYIIAEINPIPFVATITRALVTKLDFTAISIFSTGCMQTIIVVINKGHSQTHYSRFNVNNNEGFKFWSSKVFEADLFMCLMRQLVKRSPWNTLLDQNKKTLVHGKIVKMRIYDLEKIRADTLFYLLRPRNEQHRNFHCRQHWIKKCSFFRFTFFLNLNA